MIRFCTLLVAVLAVIMMPVCVSAELIDNLDGTITDTDTNLMWLQDANYAKTSGYHSSGNFDWITAKTWAENLDFAGHSDWRLPSALNSDKTGPCSGYNCSDSEMGHLYYDELGNLAYDPVTNTGPFANLVTAGNWSSTVDALDPEKAFIFNFNVGNQGPDNKGVNNWAMAVRDIFPGEDIDNDGDGYTENEGDCDDTEPLINPGVIEVCNGIDDNCVNGVDEGFNPGEICNSLPDSCGRINVGNFVCTADGSGTECNAFQPIELGNLVDNCDGTITDTDTNLMWLQDANYAKTSGYHSSGNFNWITAKTWAENLDFAGHSDWRLPSALNSDKTGPCSGYNCSDSEMGHLYYDELGNLAYDPVTNTGPFANLVAAGNWSSTVDALDPEKAFIFNFNVGNQGPDNKGVNNWAMAVRDIDNDGDGIPDDQDTCPSSDLRSKVIIDGCDSGVENVRLEDGCTISDLISQCADDADNHGEFVSAVSHIVNSLKKEGIIVGKEKGKIQKCAAKADNP